ncbi:MAG: LuxR family transcriptional regulator [Acidaminococcaceae bacterium]
MYGEFSTQDWLKFIGKDKLQTFQDVFSRIYGVSMSFLDTEGKQLTVWSQYPLFCQYIQKEQPQRCEDEGQECLALVRKVGEMKIFTCPFGLYSLICPVHFDGKIIMYAYCGGVAFGNNKISEEMRTRCHLAIKTKEEMDAIGELLRETLRLLEIDIRALEKRKLVHKASHKNIRDERISTREEDIVRLVCEGLSNKQIAEELFISERTVKTHVSNILAKLNLHDRMQLMAHYYGKERARDNEH